MYSSQSASSFREEKTSITTHNTLTTRGKVEMSLVGKSKMVRVDVLSPSMVLSTEA